MKKEEMIFLIDQLRKDKIIYATEATAVGLVCLFGFLFANEYFQEPLKSVVGTGVLLIAVGYTLYMGIGNGLRLIKIKKLEKQLLR